MKNINGHNINEIYRSLLLSKNNKPTAIIANTIKGKGVKFMENKILWHYKSPDNKQLKEAIKSLK